MGKQDYKKRNDARNLIIGIIIGVIITIGGFYWYENTPKIIHTIGQIKDTTSNTISNSLNSINDGSSQTDTQSIALQIHNLINQQREAHNLTDLIWNYNLAKVAKIHSDDMMIHSYIDHNDLQGNTPDQRVNQIASCYNGENIGWSRNYDSTQIPTIIVNGWMNSFLHEKNILNSGSTNEGIGVSINGSYAIVTEDFC